MKAKIKSFFSASKEAVLKSPIEVSISVIFFLISLYRIVYRATTVEGSNVQYYSEISDVLNYFFTCIAISYSLNIIFNKAKRIFYYLSILLPVIIFYICLFTQPEIKHETVIITVICSILLIFASKKLTDNRDFTLNAIKVTTNLIASIILAFVTYGVISSIVYSLSHIFDIETSYFVNKLIENFSIFIVSPLLFITLEQTSKKSKLEIGRSIDILFNYILTPSIVIYGVILYIYFAKIIISWTLPEGIVSTTAIIFIAGGIFVSACRTVLDRRVLDWVFKYFTYLAIPAVSLLYVSAIYRISEYGLTGNRIYLLITLITISLWLIAILFKKYNKFQYLTLFAIVVYMLFTYFPGISYNDFERRAVDRPSVKKEQDQRFVYLHDSLDSFKIDGYKNLKDISNHISSVVNDTLIVKDSNKQIIFRESCKNVIDYIYLNADIPNYKTADIDSIKNVPLIYKKDNMMIIFTSISFKRVNGNITDMYTNPNLMLTK